MKENKIEIIYEHYSDSSFLSEQDAALLTKAREFTHNAYAPYSNFHVSAAALLANGEVVTGTNQENASYPVGICAERVLLGAISSIHPGVPVQTMAISYANQTGKSDQPISPCGMCRQALLEYEIRMKQPMRLILSGQEGEVFVIASANSLLPFAFTGRSLK